MKPVTVGWLDISTANMHRAIAFSEKVFDTIVTCRQKFPLDMAMFLDDQGNRVAFHSGT